MYPLGTAGELCAQWKAVINCLKTAKTLSYTGYDSLGQEAAGARQRFFPSHSPDKQRAQEAAEVAEQSRGPLFKGLQSRLPVPTW